MSLTKRIQLSIMMFLQFMLVAAFFPQLSAYIAKIGIEGNMAATIMVTMAIGMLFSPLVGMIADRFLNAEKVLLILNALVAVFLFLSAGTQDPAMLFMWLLLAMFFYMPTWGLTSSIAITNSTTDAFPSIRVFGSIGWVCAAVFAIAGRVLFTDAAGQPVVIDGTNVPLYCAAGVAAFAAVFALFLPKTAPAAKGQPLSLVDALGLRAFSLFKDKNFAIFILCSCLVMLTFVIYWLNFGEFLAAIGIESITATMAIGQVSEMFFMLLLPLAIKIFGLKISMAFGIAAMLLRYALCYFGVDVIEFVYLAIAVHGIIFGFFFVGGQIYVSKKAPKELQAQAQGLLFLMVFGVAQFIGGYLTRFLIDYNTQIAAAASETITNAGAQVAVVAAKTIDWQNIFLIETVGTAVVLVIFLLFFKTESKEA